MDDDSRIADLRNDFLAIMVASAEIHGGTPISAQIMGYLLFEGRLVAFSELAQALGVSRGSISENTRRLVTRGAIARHKIKGDRQDYFALAETSFDEKLIQMAEKLKIIGDQIRSIASQVPGSDKASRLTQFASYQDRLSDGLVAITQHTSDSSS